VTILVEHRVIMQRGVSQQPPIERQFFSEQNELNIYNVLALDIEKKQGSGLTRQQSNRLSRTLEHYMQEVWDVNGPMPIPQLNREVVTATNKDFSGYLRRADAAPTLAVSQAIVSDPANQPRAEYAQQKLLSQQGVSVPPRPTFETNLLMDTGSRFEQLQQDRIPPSANRPSVPDFQIALSATGDEPSALSLYEQAKKVRDAEIAKQQLENQRAAGVASAIGPSVTDVNPLVRFMTPPSIINDPQANPTIAQPIASIQPVPRGPLPQDYLIKQDDVINYKETEYNLILYSADRDWYNSRMNENRYNFSVIFDPANNRQGFNVQPSSNKKFKNISRIELVKVILPTEGVDNLIKVTDDLPSVIYNTDSKINVLTYPYLLVRIPELDTNNYGTDNHIDNSFGVIQYDANWYTDTTNLSDGFLAMIPKFMKCQKVYQPTPLATLTRLTIQLQRPDGLPISNTADTLSFSGIYQSGYLPVGYGYTGLYSNITGTAVPPCGLYYIIETTTWFSQWLFQPGNRIQIKGLSPLQVSGGSTLASDQLFSYLQNDAGLVIVAIAHTSSPAAANDGPNSVGYANLLIVQAPMIDPTTGSTQPVTLGGSTDTNAALGTALETSIFTTACLINLTHQTNVVLRIITREMDAAARVRPDNL
jgi:hypothetical protein